MKLVLLALIHPVYLSFEFDVRTQKGKTKHHLEVIFSLFLIENAPSSDRKDLLSELELMKKLKPHPHVIKLMGCITETGKIEKLLLL